MRNGRRQVLGLEIGGSEAEPILAHSRKSWRRVVSAFIATASAQETPMEINLHGQRKDLRQAFINLVVGFNPNVFVTLATNSTGSVEELTQKLGKFCAMIDKALPGDNWYKLSPENRTDGLFTIEHTASNIHAHGILRLPTHEHDDLPLLVERKWSRLSEAGHTDFQKFDDAARLAAYCTKEMHRASFDTNQIVLTREFMKSR